MKATICPVADVPAEGAKPVSFFGRDYLVYRAGGEPRAVFNACVHLGGPWSGAATNSSAPGTAPRSMPPRAGARTARKAPRPGCWCCPPGWKTGC